MQFCLHFVIYYTFIALVPSAFLGFCFVTLFLVFIDVQTHILFTVGREAAQKKERGSTGQFCSSQASCHLWSGQASAAQGASREGVGILLVGRVQQAKGTELLSPSSVHF